jgi:hypothetical protein
MKCNGSDGSVPKSGSISSDEHEYHEWYASENYDEQGFDSSRGPMENMCRSIEWKGLLRAISTSCAGSPDGISRIDWLLRRWIDSDLFNTLIGILLARCIAAVFRDAGVDSLVHDATYPQVKAVKDKS